MLFQSYFVIFLGVIAAALFLSQVTVLSRSYTESRKDKSFYPKQEEKRWLTIGIRTVEPQHNDDVIKSIQSLLDLSDPGDIDKIYVVVFLAELNKEVWKERTKKLLIHNFLKFFENRTLRVIKAPREFYSGYNTSDGLDEEWHKRTKQNYDYAFLMQYCQEMSPYYLQMEGDAVAKKGYLKFISRYVRIHTFNWMFLNFSPIGLLGNFYRSVYLEELSKFLVTFSKDNPPDVNNAFYFDTKGQIKRIRTFPKPVLFEQIR